MHLLWIQVPPSLLGGSRERLLSSVSGLQILSLTPDLGSSVSLSGRDVLQRTERDRLISKSVFICDPAPGETHRIVMFNYRWRGCLVVYLAALVIKGHRFSHSAINITRILPSDLPELVSWCNYTDTQLPGYLTAMKVDIMQTLHSLSQHAWTTAFYFSLSPRFVMRRTSSRAYYRPQLQDGGGFALLCVRVSVRYQNNLQTTQQTLLKLLRN